ncbi:PH domain-containing protein [Jeongeupia naejangsanensis]|uniref:PH domain-containing protein n=1 Tax=Jeongeupia naejangsanensis TaxID=613195 RepID=A0ABS2BH74_9NEIS|nr:PH domain-containing protein [Jeongeupia naejangsanensis]MBM3114971.1 PH domain-containing protein [Jeongeupia naejangsanensis]
MAFDFKNALPEERKSEYLRLASEIGDDQFFTKKELNHLPEVLAEGEQVLAFCSGLMEGNTWLITLTDRRVIFLDKGMLYGLKQTSINLDKINAVSGETGILFGKIKIQDGAAQRTIENVIKKVVIPFTNRVRDAMAANQAQSKAVHVTAQATPPAVAVADELIEKLERLASLKERGILTVEEFEQQKARILAI